MKPSLLNDLIKSMNKFQLFPFKPVNKFQSFPCRPIETHNDFLALIAHPLQGNHRAFQRRDARQQLAGSRVGRSGSGLLNELLQMPGNIKIAQGSSGTLDHVSRTIVLDKVTDDACRHSGGDMTIVMFVGIDKIVGHQFVAREIEQRRPTSS